MKKLLVIFYSIICLTSFSQVESVWDQGVPLCPDDPYITGLINKVGGQDLYSLDSITNNSKVKLFREIGFAFYDRGMYDEADWYFKRAKNYKEKVEFEKVEPQPSKEDIENMKEDLEVLKTIPKSYDNLSKNQLKDLAKLIDLEIKKLIKEKDSLEKIENVNPDVLDAKKNTIKSLKKEKELIDLTIEKGDLKKESKGLKFEKAQLKKYLIWLIIGSTILILIIGVLIQRKTIKTKDLKIDEQLDDINKKNTYLDYAARIIRHDMHSGINTYIPRGLTSLTKKLPSEEISRLNLESPLRMIKEGLNHTQKVYGRVYEFTNLVKRNVVLNKTKVDLKTILESFVETTSYKNQVKIDDLIYGEVNVVLFCNAIDNLIKNGLKFNNSEDKKVHIYMEEEYLIIQDNGVGLHQNDFKKIINGYLTNKEGNESGLGLKITKTILEEHGFDLDCEKNNIGTKIKIKIKQIND